MKKTLAQIAADLRKERAKLKYVSRGGLKLEHALKEFKVDPTDKICLDIGASTGGFTDCLLQHGAKKVYCVDVGYGQLAWVLRQDARVVVIDRQNIRHLPKEKIPDKAELVVVDLSFISLKLIFPEIKKFLADKAHIIALIKTQFEVGKKEVGKKGVVEDPALHQRVISEIKEAGLKENWHCAGVVPSPILGAEGNQEFLILFQSP